MRWRMPPTIACAVSAGTCAPLGRGAEHLQQQPLVAGGGEAHVRERRGPRSQRLHEQQAYSHGRAGGVGEQRLTDGVQAVRPAALPLPRLDREPARARSEHVVGGQEARLPAREQLVERAPRHTREGDHVGDGRVRVAASRHRLDHRAVDPRALVARHLLAPEGARPARQAAVEGRWRGADSTHPEHSKD